MSTTRIGLRLAALLTTFVLVSGDAVLAEDTPKPAEPASDLARNLIAARQANAKAQHEGRPAVWYFASPSAAEAMPVDARE